MGITEKILLVLFAVFALLAVLRLFAAPLKLAGKLLVNTLLGFALLGILSALDVLAKLSLGLNLFNSESLLFWKELGLEAAAVSMELRWQQLRDLRKVLPCEAVVYGRLPLMIMENCVIRNQLGCRDAGRDYADRSPACRCGQENVLVDRTGAQFPLVGQWGHRCEIENSKVLFLADKPEWRQLGLTRARLRFTTEPPEECVRVLRAYQGRSDYRPDQLTRGLFYRGVE